VRHRYYLGVSQAYLDREEFGRWRREADRALEGARLQTGAGLHNWACFAAEQAGQLALKALLHGLGRGPWGHDLVRLGEMVQAAGLEVPDEVAASLRRLGRHDVPSRYPDAHAAGPPGAHYGPEDAQEAIADAERVLAYVDRTWRSLGG
jgi:HEPN domain-containing protein